MRRAFSGTVGPRTRLSLSQPAGQSLTFPRSEVAARTSWWKTMAAVLSVRAPVFVSRPRTFSALALGAASVLCLSACDPAHLDLLQSRAAPQATDLPPTPTPAPPIRPLDSGTPAPLTTSEDAGPPAPRSEAGTPIIQVRDLSFGEPRLVPGLGTESSIEDDPTLTADLLELYYNSNRASSVGWDIWRSVRSSVDDAWPEPELVVELSGPGQDTTPGISADGLTIWLGRTQSCGPRGGLLVATRADRQSVWTEPQCVNELNSEAEDLAPEVTQNGLLMVLTSNRTLDRGMDLFQLRRPSLASSWSAAEPLDSVNTDARESEGHLSQGGRLLLFASTRDSEQRRLYLAYRDTPDAPFRTPEPLSLVAPVADESDPWISEDMSTLYFTWSVTGEHRIYEVPVTSSQFAAP